MTKIIIPIPTVIEDLRKLFKIDEETEFKSIETNGSFLIHKQTFGRGTTIEMLQNYFEDKVIENGQCSVGSLTMLFTSFKILPL